MPLPFNYAPEDKVARDWTSTHADARIAYELNSMHICATPKKSLSLIIAAEMTQEISPALGVFHFH